MRNACSPYGDTQDMEQVTIAGPRVLVLAEGASASDINNKRGHLFEVFIAQLLHAHGYDKPTNGNLNNTADGIELDVVATSSFTNNRAIVEAKAYSASVKAQACTSFIGKLQMARFDNIYDDVHGYLFVLPRLVRQGEEFARKFERNDNKFHYLDADSVVELLVDRGMIRRTIQELEGYLTSDHAVVITESGIYSAAKVLDPETRRTDHVVVWGSSNGTPVPTAATDLLAMDPYAQGAAIKTVSRMGQETTVKAIEDPSHPLIVPVKGSSSDFEYQFPASPKFFVGRRQAVIEAKQVITKRQGSFVLNAQSGWGKSSLALQMKQLVESEGGYALVIDSRTATEPSFVVEALRTAAVGAAEAKLLNLPESSSWASLQSSIATLERCTWKKDSPLLIIFDQFENVFQSEPTTREFRNLSLLLNEFSKSLIVGYAWKTDLVATAELHPFQLRDEIRANSYQIRLDPMGSSDIDALLRRLEKELAEKIAPDLRQRCREYSQGLPWLFKKLANHILKEISEHGKSQEVLVSEGLNVQSLFDSDLAGLSLVENEAIRHIARYAPISATEVAEKYSSKVIQSLLNARLAVAVGGKLDTYWDIFRDFLNTGQVPIEDSFIVRQNPSAVSRLVIAVVNAGGKASVPDLCGKLGISSTGIFNLSRELRLFGVTAYAPNRVQLQHEVVQAENPEDEIRTRVARALKRHRAYSLLLKTIERAGDSILLSLYADELPKVFPAVAVSERTWLLYARAFARWFDYAGIAVLAGNRIKLAPEGYIGRVKLLSTEGVSKARSGYSLHLAASTCLPTLLTLDLTPKVLSDLTTRERKMITPLASLGLVVKDSIGRYKPADGAVVSGQPSAEFLLKALREYPGGKEGLEELLADPAVDNMTLGTRIRTAVGARWQDSTASEIGSDFRNWAKVAGIVVHTARRRPRTVART